MRLSIIKFPNLLETVQFNRVWAMSCKATILLLKGMNTQWSQQPIGLVDVTRVRLDTKWNCRWNSHVVCYGLSIFWSIVRDRQETLPWSVTRCHYSIEKQFTLQNSFWVFQQGNSNTRCNYKSIWNSAISCVWKPGWITWTRFGSRCF